MTGDNSLHGNIEVYDAYKRFLFSFAAHNDAIEHIKLLSNGNIASCSDDKTIKVWNTSTWSLAQTLSGHTDWVYQLEEINSNTLASASADRTVHIWNIKTGAIISIYSAGKPVYTVKLLPNGYLAIGLQGSNQENLKIIDYKKSSLVKNLVGHTSTVFNFEVLDAKFLASASADMKVMIWDLTATNPLKYTLDGHSDTVMGLKLLSSTLLASGSYDKTIKIWDWTGGFLVRTLPGHTNFIWLSLDIFSENILISGSLDKTIKFWNITSGSLMQTLTSNIQISTLTMLSACKYKIKTVFRFIKIYRVIFKSHDCKNFLTQIIQIVT